MTVNALASKRKIGRFGSNKLEMWRTSNQFRELENLHFISKSFFTAMHRLHSSSFIHGYLQTLLTWFDNVLLRPYQWICKIYSIPHFTIDGTFSKRSYLELVLGYFRGAAVLRFTRLVFVRTLTGSLALIEKQFLFFNSGCDFSDIGVDDFCLSVRGILVNDVWWIRGALTGNSMRLGVFKVECRVCKINSSDMGLGNVLKRIDAFPKIIDIEVNKTFSGAIR